MIRIDRRKMQISASLDAWVFAALDAVATQQNVGVSRIANDIIVDWCSRGGKIRDTAKIPQRRWRKIGVNIMVDADAVDVIDTLARSMDIPPSWIINDAIASWMIAQGKVDEKTKKITITEEKS